MSGTPYDPTSPSSECSVQTHAGLIELTTFYNSTDPISGGGTGPESGAVTGYEELRQVKQGATGTPINLSFTQYTTNTANGVTIYRACKTTVFRNADGSGAITTSLAYTWPGGSNQASRIVTTYPVVSTAQNGSGIADTRTQNFDVFGNQTSEIDPRGFQHDQSFDVTMGVVTQSIRDVAGLHLVSDFSHDDQARLVKSLGPAHLVDGNSVRTASWTVYRDDIDQVWSARGYETVGGTPVATLVNPVSITQHDDDGRTTDRIKATRGSTVESSGNCG